MLISFSCIHEDTPGEKWKGLFERTWPHYKAWFLSEGYLARKGYLTSVTALETHMPELMHVYQTLQEILQAGDLESRFLTMYDPPPYLSACSQVAWTRGDTVLIRNYDYSFKMFEGVMLYTHWLKPVIGVSDCTWGLLDGMNASGLAASLTFGGRKVTGDGFGIPLVIRYILETASTVDEGIAVLKRVPVHMAYNVTLLDKLGNFTTAYLSPDRPPVFVDSAVATNHQVEVEWTDYASLTGTIERKRHLEKLVSQTKETGESMLRHFLHPPLYSNNFEKSFGTLYTIAYHLQDGRVKVRWPDASIDQSFAKFTE
jgi:predicted choloylglycine hydrolase